MRLTCILLWIVFSCPVIASAATYLVNPDGSGDFPTIPEAIIAAVDGDVIELGDGLFTGPEHNEISLRGKDITIRSLGGPEFCAIEGNSAVFHLVAEPVLGTIEGITITGSQRGVMATSGTTTFINCYIQDNHTSNSSGCGIHCDQGAAPVFIECKIRNNVSEPGDWSRGGGLYCAANARPVFLNCLFEGNVASFGGGFLARTGGYPYLYNCLFIGNSAETGGAGYCDSGSFPRLWNCTLYGNSATDGAGLCCNGSTAPDLNNTIIAFSLIGSAFYRWDSSSQPQMECCDIFGNEGGDWTGGIEDQLGISGNISEHPFFCDPEAGNFALQEYSPCAPGTPPNEDCELIGALPVGCGGTPVQSDSWGGIKLEFR